VGFHVAALRFFFVRVLKRRELKEDPQATTIKEARRTVGNPLTTESRHPDLTS
jgi:hypothetical protein